ncbi:alpha-crystallin A chain-like [Argiope bruennichi]|uniref:Alpha-crystallin B chain like protein n=1 Tax=Argiope bruennichi TaxID=94029 RepID=A0A8T0FH72_ARGBR|nr:alpha-crystallin A chain-like [Argiope bruennichi]KAF8788680.1 Alpha-crystallin B chain like protein [Argiope bruennichi]
MFGKFSLGLYDPYFPWPYFGMRDDEIVLSYFKEKSDRCLPAKAFNTKPDSKKRKHFKATLNVKHFSPGDIEVKVVDNFVVIHGKRDQPADQHGLVSREFTKRYQLHADVDGDAIKSSWSPDGVLTVYTPKSRTKERVVPITFEKPILIEKFETWLEEDRKIFAEHRRTRAQRNAKLSENPIMVGMEFF